MSRRRPAIPRTCLLFGYCGNRNTGSDVRMLTIIDDIRATFGPQTNVTVVSQNREITREVVQESESLKIVEIPFGEPLLFGNRVQRLVMKHDATFLIEGSALQQNFSPWLLYAYLWTAVAAWLARRPCIAYAVDVGEMSQLNKFLTLRSCRLMDLVITRTDRARQRLIEMGYKSPVVANTDTAFQYLMSQPLPDLPPRGRPLVGIAPIEFYHWPVKLRFFGKREDRLRWPYHFTWTEEGRRKSRALIEVYARFIEECLDQKNVDVSLIAMEQLDRRFCEQITSALPERLRPRIQLVGSFDTPPAKMTQFLRSLDFLITSRYHASVLSLGAGVPQMAIAHDERIESVYRELGIADDFLLPHDAIDLGDRLSHTFDKLQQQREAMRDMLQRKNREQFLPRCLRNREELRKWVERRQSGLEPALGKA